MSKHELVEDGEVVVDDPSSLRIEIEGFEGAIVSMIPVDFFVGMESLVAGKLFGIVTVKSLTGGKAEVCSCIPRQMSFVSSVERLTLTRMFVALYLSRSVFKPTPFFCSKPNQIPPQVLPCQPCRNQGLHHTRRLLHSTLL